jgi:hypothetical protein
MKKMFISVMIADLAGNVYAGSGDTITLDLSKSLKPGAITFISEGYWTETYNDKDYTFIEFEGFKFSSKIYHPSLLRNSYPLSSWSCSHYIAIIISPKRTPSIS